MATAEHETQTDFDRWLQARRTFVGASESPAILGEGYAAENAWTVWARKTGVLPEEESREDWEWGHEIQPIVLKMFERKTGIKVEDLGPYTIQRHAELPYIGCTLDAVAQVSEGRAVVEAKNVGQYLAHDWADGETPLRVQIQIQHQMLAAGAQLGYAVACLGGNRLVWRKVERNERFIAALTARLAEFWDLVESKTPPAVDATAACARVLAKLHPDDNGQAVVLDATAEKWFAELEETRTQIRKLEERKEWRENQLAALLGPNTFAELPNGETWSYKSRTVREHVRKETTFRVFHHCKPKPIRR